MNPGHNEALKNEPFVGPSGTLLKRLLEPCPPVPTYLTNAARCSSPGFEPTTNDYKACAPHLLEDLHAIITAHDGASLVLLCLGTAATQQVHRLASLKRPNVTACLSRQGTLLDLPAPGSLLLPGTRGLGAHLSVPSTAFFCYHPAALLREPNLTAPTRDHLRLLFDHLAGLIPTPTRPHLIPPRPPETHRCPTPSSPPTPAPSPATTNGSGPSNSPTSSAPHPTPLPLLAAPSP